MAPTEILAEQHFITIRRLLESSRFRMGLLTGATPAKKRREIQAELSGGSLHLVVGTHALVEGPVEFRELGLVIIDEQHRFGVLQRAALRSKGMHPDVLVMTATPIPRTLALRLRRPRFTVSGAAPDASRFPSGGRRAARRPIAGCASVTGRGASWSVRWSRREK
jgi:RecG-like helicase